MSETERTEIFTIVNFGFNLLSCFLNFGSEFDPLHKHCNARQCLVLSGREQRIAGPYAVMLYTYYVGYTHTGDSPNITLKSGWNRISAIRFWLVFDNFSGLWAPTILWANTPHPEFIQPRKIGVAILKPENKLNKVLLPVDCWPGLWRCWDGLSNMWRASILWHMLYVIQ